MLLEKHIEYYINNWHNNISGLANYFSKPVEVIEDYVSNVFLRFQINNDEFKNYQHFCNKLIKSVSRRIIDDYRKNKRQANYIECTGKKVTTNDGEHSLIVSDILNKFNRLPDKYLEIILLRANEYKYKEISEEIKKSIPYVKTNIFKAKKLLKKYKL